MDVEESKLQGRVVVRPRLFKDLDDLRQFYNDLPSYLSQVAKEISMELQGTGIESLNLVYFPQLGFLITIPLKDSLPLETMTGLESQFSTAKFAYFKNESTKSFSLS